MRKLKLNKILMKSALGVQLISTYLFAFSILLQATCRFQQILLQNPNCSQKGFNLIEDLFNVCFTFDFQPIRCEFLTDWEWSCQICWPGRRRPHIFPKSPHSPTHLLSANLEYFCLRSNKPLKGWMWTINSSRMTSNPKYWKGPKNTPSTNMEESWPPDAICRTILSLIAFGMNVFNITVQTAEGINHENLVCLSKWREEVDSCFLTDQLLLC